jgi:hypothetical protein
MKTVGGRGIETNEKRLTMGKLGECAAARALNLDPDETVNFNVFDVECYLPDLILPGGTRVEVKTSEGRWLYPPVEATRSEFDFVRWHRNNFDVLVHCSPGVGDYYFVNGWISARDFVARHQASEGLLGQPPEPGTRFVDRRELHPIPSLLALDYRGEIWVR